MGAWDTMFDSCMGQAPALTLSFLSDNRSAVNLFCSRLVTLVRDNHVTAGVLDFEDIAPVDAGYWITGVSCSAVCVLTLILNMFSVWVFARKQGRSPTHILLAVVSSLDLLTCAFQLPLPVYVYLLDGYRLLPTRSWCDVYHYVYNFLPASLHSMAFLLNVCLSVQRCVGVKDITRCGAKSVCGYKGTLVAILVCMAASAVVHTIYPIAIGVSGVTVIDKQMLSNGKLHYVESCRVGPRYPDAYNAMMSSYIWARVILLQSVPAIVLAVCNTVLITTSLRGYSYRRRLIGRIGAIMTLHRNMAPTVDALNHMGEDEMGVEHPSVSEGNKSVHHSNLGDNGIKHLHGAEYNTTEHVSAVENKNTKNIFGAEYISTKHHSGAKYDNTEYHSGAVYNNTEYHNEAEYINTEHNIRLEYINTEDPSEAEHNNTEYPIVTEYIHSNSEYISVEEYHDTKHTSVEDNNNTEQFSEAGCNNTEHPIGAKYMTGRLFGEEHNNTEDPSIVEYKIDITYLNNSVVNVCTTHNCTAVAALDDWYENASHEGIVDGSQSPNGSQLMVGCVSHNSTEISSCEEMKESEAVSGSQRYDIIDSCNSFEELEVVSSFHSFKEINSCKELKESDHRCMAITLCKETGEPEAVSGSPQKITDLHQKCVRNFGTVSYTGTSATAGECYTPRNTRPQTFGNCKHQEGEMNSVESYNNTVIPEHQCKAVMPRGGHDSDNFVLSATNLYAHNCALNALNTEKKTSSRRACNNGDGVLKRASSCTTALQCNKWQSEQSATNDSKFQHIRYSLRRHEERFGRLQRSAQEEAATLCNCTKLSPQETTKSKHGSSRDISKCETLNGGAPKFLQSVQTHRDNETCSKNCTPISRLHIQENNASIRSQCQIATLKSNGHAQSDCVTDGSAASSVNGVPNRLNPDSPCADSYDKFPQKTPSYSSSGELRSTVMLVLVTSFTLIAEIFVIVMLIFQFVDSIAVPSSRFLTTSELGLLFSVSNLVTLLTFPLNFFIFCGLSSNFRTALRGALDKLAASFSKLAAKVMKLLCRR